VIVKALSDFSEWGVVKPRQNLNYGPASANHRYNEQIGLACGRHPVAGRLVSRRRGGAIKLRTSTTATTIAQSVGRAMTRQALAIRRGYTFRLVVHATDRPR
jgi:hypothetical protein